jgi:hypothetical protein
METTPSPQPTILLNLNKVATQRGSRRAWGLPADAVAGVATIH